MTDPTFSAALPFASNNESKQSYRVIGTTDIDGNGTRHDVDAIDPFIFMDETELSGDAPWPFPAHPHTGLLAMTYLIDGAIETWDNRPGQPAMRNVAGGLYWIYAGRGIVHEETPIYDRGALRWLQIWLNPGLVERPRASADSGLVLPDEVESLSGRGTQTRVVVDGRPGRQGRAVFGLPFRLRDVLVQPGAEFEIAAGDEQWQGFLYVLDGTARIGDAVARPRSLISLPQGGAVVGDNPGESPLRLFVADGMPRREPFFKLLGGGGAVIEASADRARDAMRAYERDPAQFGVYAWQGFSLDNALRDSFPASDPLPTHPGSED